MVWEKVSTELSEFLEKALQSCDCQKKKMFGCPVYFVNNNMFAGVHQKSLFIRLSEADRKEIFAAGCGATVFEPMEGRTMKEYVVLPESVYGNPQTFAKWLNRSYEFVLGLPEKEVKAGKKGKKKE